MKNKNARISLTAGAKALSDQTHTVCYVAGRSGGHIIPALTHARLHAEKQPQDRLMFIATTAALDVSIVETATHIHTKIYIKLSNIPRRMLAMPLFFVNGAVALVKSIFFLRRHKVTHVISMGGLLSIPVCLAARCLRIPVSIFELNATPGKASLFLARFATSLFVCFEKTKASFAQPSRLVAYPLQYKQLPTEQALKEHIRTYGLQQHHKKILLLGGSQGSVFLNKIMGVWLEANPHLWKSLHIIHQTGQTDPFNWHAWYQSRGISATVFPYTSELAYWYSCADLIICRAGAGTLFETLFFKKPALVVPLITHQTAHQVNNAAALVEQFPHLFCMLEQESIEHDPARLFVCLNQLLTQIEPPLINVSK